MVTCAQLLSQLITLKQQDRLASPVRMSDVARLAGVSTMTVSRVLNEQPGVAGPLRQRVLDAVHRLRYQRNEVARSLRDQRSRQVGILVPYLFDPFFAACAHTISQIAYEKAYSVVLATTQENAEAERKEAGRMLQRSVEGMIVIPAVAEIATQLTADLGAQIPIVSIDRPLTGSEFSSVLVENRQGAQMMTAHLLGLGHRRIAFVGLTDDLYTMRLRQQGYRDALSEADLPGLVVNISREGLDSDTALDRLLARHHRPTALFCGNNLTTRRMLHALQRRGLRIPDEMAIVGFDDFETADLLSPGITVIRQPVEALGRAAGELLFQLIQTRNAKVEAPTVMLELELVVRGSCGSNMRAPQEEQAPGSAWSRQLRVKSERPDEHP